VLVVEAVFFVENKLRIDDPVGAISVHGVNGAWGIISLGLFADGTYGDGWNGVPGTVRGLFYGDGGGQLMAQIIGILANMVYVGIMAFLVYKVIDMTIGNRVSPEAEMEGLDIPEMGAAGYSGVKMDKYSETPMEID
jgi:Amt family ammonium transporter